MTPAAVHSSTETRVMKLSRRRAKYRHLTDRAIAAAKRVFEPRLNRGVGASRGWRVSSNVGMMSAASCPAARAQSSGGFSPPAAANYGGHMSAGLVTSGRTVAPVVDSLEPRVMFAAEGGRIATAAEAAGGLPDLAVTWIQPLEGPYINGEKARAAVGVINAAAAQAQAPATTLALYLSNDLSVDPGDRRIASARVRPLKVGRSVMVRFRPFVIPGDLPAGRYTVLARVDDAGAVDEQFEVNNT